MISNVKFVIRLNKRLLFKDSQNIVTDFIRRRLNYFGCKSIEFVQLPHDAHLELPRIIDSHNTTRFVAISDIMNPLTDPELIHQMALHLENSHHRYCSCIGAIPGTQIDQMVDTSQDFEIAGRSIYQHDTQSLFNNQFNLYKYKRLKIFLALIENINDLHKKTVPDLIGLLEQRDIFEWVYGMCTGARLRYADKCPHCFGDLVQLPMKMSQPFCGFLPHSRPIYHRCVLCGLVVASPTLEPDDLHLVYDEFDREDFAVSSNNPYTPQSVKCDLSRILPNLPDSNKILDLGGGTGNFSIFVKKCWPHWTVVHSDFEEKCNRYLSSLGIETIGIDFIRNEIGKNKFNLITAWEVIEHIPFVFLDNFLGKVHAALLKGGFFIFSTPNMDSPLCHLFDFFAQCPPFHTVVYGESFLRKYFENNDRFEIYDIRASSDLLDDAVTWFQYGLETCPSMQLRSVSFVMQKIFSSFAADSLKEFLLNQGIGTETIFTLRKR